MQTMEDIIIVTVRGDCDNSHIKMYTCIIESFYSVVVNIVLHVLLVHVLKTLLKLNFARTSGIEN